MRWQCETVARFYWRPLPKQAARRQQAGALLQTVFHAHQIGTRPTNLRHGKGEQLQYGNWHKFTLPFYVPATFWASAWAVVASVGTLDFFRSCLQSRRETDLGDLATLPVRLFMKDSANSCQFMEYLRFDPS